MREILQDLIDQLKPENSYDFEIEFRGRGGWWAMPTEARYWGDNGIYLGSNYQEAKKHIIRLF